MSFYANLSIKNKLIAGYAVILACCCLVGFFSIRGIAEIKSRIDDLQNNLLPTLTTIADIDRHAQHHRRTFLQYLLEHSERRKELAAHLLKEEQQIKEKLEKVSTFPLHPQERRQLAEAVLVFQQYFDTAEAVRRKAQSGIDHELLEADNEKVYAVFSKLEAGLKQLSLLNAEEGGVHYEQTIVSYQQLRFWLSFLIICSLLVAVTMTLLISNSIAKPLLQVLVAVRQQQEGSRRKALLMEAIADGDLSQEVIVTQPLDLETEEISKDETGQLLKAIVGMSEVQYLLDQAFAEMTAALRHNREQETLHNWLKNGHHELNAILRGDKPVAELTEQVLIFLVEYLGACTGVFYLFDERDSVLQMAAGYAVADSGLCRKRTALGEGLAGQAALERKLLCLPDAPPGYLRISSGLGESSPAGIAVLPLDYNDNLLGVLEIGSLRKFSDHDLELLRQSKEAIAIALSVNRSRKQVNDLLEQTQAQTEELRVQQEELQQTNEELEERAQMLEQQREHIRAKNRDIEEASLELRRKAEELERVSTYKSEFLANMSHELRTPLNSLMILSSLLKDNREGNLTRKQVEFAATINSAGRDLLELINDILDLSKIESGHMEFHYEELAVTDICEQLAGIFNHVAADKQIAFSVQIDGTAPATILTDGQRTQQILKNLLSNACKFTSQGEVKLLAYRPENTENPLGLPAVAFSAHDTGIGIPEDKQELVFSAFHQADGSTSRTYGGTGLGLSISRQLARSMGGEITLSSTVGQGSVFTLYLPLAGGRIPAPAGTAPVTATTVKPQPAVKPPATSQPASEKKEKGAEPLPSPVPDDRALMQQDARSILIIEDDLSFAGILADMVRDRGFRALVAADGESGISLAERYHPSAIILDVMLPHIDGWAVMRSLKDNPETRHIPVHFVTCLEERQKAMGMGAIGFVTKPVSGEQLDSVFSTLENAISRTMKMLLIVEDDETQAKAMVALLEERNVSIKVADSGKKAIQLLSSEPFDCIVLDLGLADMGAFELLEEMKRLDPERRIPVIIHTGRELTRDDERRLHHYAESIIIKGAKSPERLLNEVTLFLHLIESSLDPDKQRMIRSALDKEAMLEGKKVLIVDDDMRNIFSLSSALSEKDMVILEAENGREALRQLDQHPDIDLVLMDIMMPEMNGYEAMRAIRADSRFHKLPIIALTAKAMKGDREECLNAGASDYIPKPVDMEKLFSLLRVWLYTSATTVLPDTRL